MSIPIRNLYYVFCYAWEHFSAGEAVEVGKDDCPDLQNLLAKLLINGLRRLIRRGFDRGYVEIVEDTRSLRGRLLLDDMVKRQTMLRGQATCQFDELQIDILHNQILKATVRLMLGSQDVLPELRHHLGVLLQRLEAVGDIRLSSKAFRRVQISKNNRQYRMLMKLCEFVFHSTLPDENGRGAQFADVLDDEVRMSAVFEDFLRNFFLNEQSRFSVKRDFMEWDAIPLTEGATALMPTLQTDISLHSTNQVIVLEAKYYRDPLEGRTGFTQKLRSHHLRQLFTYMHHMSLRHPDKQVDGVLVYPMSGSGVAADYLISGHYTRAITINFDQHWSAIHEDLLSITERPFGIAKQPHLDHPASV